METAFRERKLTAALCTVWQGNAELTTVVLGQSMTEVPARRDMRLRSGGVTLSSLCVILLRLAERGKLRLDDPVARWMPDLPEAKTVTLRMLANCSAGYPDYVLDPDFVEATMNDPFRQWTPEALRRIAFSKPLHYPPGKGWNYSHTNFVILGEIMEKATQKTVGDLFREHIFVPLKLQGSAYPATAEMASPVLHAYSLDRGVFEDSTYWNPSWTSHSGRMTSTLMDVATIWRAIGAGSLLSPRSRQEQIAPTVVGLGQNRKDRYYGLGVILLNGWICQNPRFGGYNLFVGYLPAKKLMIAVTTTLGPKSEDDVAHSAAIFKSLNRLLAPEAMVPEEVR